MKLRREKYPGFHIYYAGRRQVPRKLRAFIDFGRELLSRAQARTTA